MIASMTGYGHAEAAVEGNEISVSIRSLNSKTAHLQLIVPPALGDMEIELRKMVMDRMIRGKIDMTITFRGEATADAYFIDEKRFTTHLAHLRSFVGQHDSVPSGEMVQAVMSIPGVVRAGQHEVSDEERSNVLTLVQQALDSAHAFRIAEGKAMHEDLKSSCQTLLDRLHLISPYEEERMNGIRTRIESKLGELQNTLDKNRLEQEMVYFVERLDLNEEKERLIQHCQYFMQTLERTELKKGRTLQFISQEMGREINTIGSKANDHRIQHEVVHMKEALDEIKEMLTNVL